MYKIPRYQSGAYVPGLTSDIFQHKLGQDIRSTQEDLLGGASDIQKREKKGKIGEWLGKKGGKWLFGALGKGLMAANPLLGLAVSSGGAGLGSWLGGKLAKGKKVNVQNKHGLLGDQFTELQDYATGLDKSAVGRAVGTAGTEMYGGLKSDTGKKIWDEQFTLEGKEKFFGKKLGSKSHEDLMKMTGGQMFDESKFGQGLNKSEDWLAGIMQKGYDNYRNRPAKGIGPTPPWNPYALGPGSLPRHQTGGEVSEEVNMDDVLKRQALMERFGNVFDESQSVDDRFKNFTTAKMLMDKSSGLFKNFVKSETGYSASGDRGNLTDEEYYGGMRNLENEKDMLLNMFKSSLKSRQPEGMQEGGMAYPSQINGEGMGQGMSGNQELKNLFQLERHKRDEGLMRNQKPGALEMLLMGNNNPDMEQARLQQQQDRLQQQEVNYNNYMNQQPGMFEGMQSGGMAYPLQMSGGGYLPEHGFGGLIQYRKGY